MVLGGCYQHTVMLDFKSLLYNERKTEVNVELGVLRAERVETKGTTSSSKQGFQRAEKIEDIFISKFACCTKLQ